MRLDEWQRFIESQFLEEEAAQEAQPTPPTKEGRQETATLTLPEPPLTPTLPFEEEEPAPPLRPEPFRRNALVVAPSAEAQSVAPASLLWEEEPDVEPAHAEIATDDELTPEPQPVVAELEPVAVEPTPEPEPEPVRPPPTLAEVNPLLAQKPTLETEIPSFESYLKPRPLAPAPVTSAVAPEPFSDDAPEAERDEPQEIETPGIFVRRAPKTRARHARNVRPEHVPSGLSAAELWSDVPKHVQTLLALEREEEVAQYSYKRPFSEDRRELIARLLDPALTLEETARLLNVCPTTVRRYTNRGILTHYRKEPERGERAANSETTKETRQRRFRLSDVLAFLEAQQVALEADREKERERERKRRASRKSNGAADESSA